MPVIVHRVSPKPPTLTLSIQHCRALRMCLYLQILLRLCAGVPPLTFHRQPGHSLGLNSDDKLRLRTIRINCTSDTCIGNR
jgi:hypothetical protein